VVLVVAVLFSIDDGDGLGLIEGGDSLSYALVFRWAVRAATLEGGLQDATTP
jgi:hypothetical protein